MTDTQTTTFTERHMVTAMCLWEAFLEMARGTDGSADAAAEGDDENEGEADGETADSLNEKLEELLDGHGSFTIRSALVDLVRPCDEGWDAFVQSDADTSEQFDWDWCPRFLRSALEDGNLEAAIERQYSPR